MLAIRVLLHSFRHIKNPSLLPALITWHDVNQPSITHPSTLRYDSITIHAIPGPLRHTNGVSLSLTCSTCSFASCLLHVSVLPRFRPFRVRSASVVS